MDNGLSGCGMEVIELERMLIGARSAQEYLEVMREASKIITSKDVDVKNRALAKNILRVAWGQMKMDEGITTWTTIFYVVSTECYGRKGFVLVVERRLKKVLGIKPKRKGK